MNKLFFIPLFLLVATKLEATFNPQRSLSTPTHQLTKLQTSVRNVVDFFAEEWGYQALREENENFIKNIINNLGMQDYTIEIRGMSYKAKKIFGHINTFALGSKFFAYIYVSEDWFDTLSSEQKEALIRHELMHIKKEHVVKKIICLGISSAVLHLFAKVLNNKIQIWANTPIATKEYINTVDQNDHFTKDILDEKKLARAQSIEKILHAYIVTLGFALLKAKYSRMCEKEADIEAAKTMQNKEGYISMLMNLQDNHEENRISKFKFKQAFLDFFEPVIALFRTHPKCDERIAYIKELA